MAATLLIVAVLVGVAVLSAYGTAHRKHKRACRLPEDIQ